MHKSAAYHSALDKHEHLYYGYYMNTAMPAELGVRVSALSSGSSGNAFLLEAGGVKLLFDAGLNAGTLEYYLRQRGTSASELSAVFISHEHIDHLRGAGMLARRYKLPVVANEGTFLAGAEQFGTIRDKVVQALGREVYVGGITVRTFSVSHDAAETVFAPAGISDGPLPTHYEPQESPFHNALYGSDRNPIRLDVPAA